MQLARSANGHFAKGNAGGSGNPHAKRTAHIKRVLLDAVTDDDVRAIVKSLIEEAKTGNAKAAELILNRLIGKPTAEPLAGDADVELTEQEEADQLAAWRADIQARLSRLPEDQQQRILDKVKAQRIDLIDGAGLSKVLPTGGTACGSSKGEYDASVGTFCEPV